MSSYGENMLEKYTVFREKKNLNLGLSIFGFIFGWTLVVKFQKEKIVITKALGPGILIQD